MLALDFKIIIPFEHSLVKNFLLRTLKLSADLTKRTWIKTELGE